MAEDVIPRLQSRWDLRRPLASLVDELLARPDLGVVVDALGLDLDPLQVRLDHLAAVASTLGHVPKDRPVRVRPRAVGAPRERDRAACRDSRRGRARGAVLVAVDIGGAVRIWRDESGVKVLRVPGRYGRERATVDFLVVVVHLTAR